MAFCCWAISKAGEILAPWFPTSTQHLLGQKWILTNQSVGNPQAMVAWRLGMSVDIYRYVEICYDVMWLANTYNIYIYIYTVCIYNELNIKWLSNQQLSLGPPHPPRARRATLPKRPVDPLPPTQPSGSTWRHNAKYQATPYGLTCGPCSGNQLELRLLSIIFYLAKLVYYPLRPGREKMGPLRVAAVPNSDVQRHTINYETNQVRCLPSHTAGLCANRTTHTPTWNNLHGGSIFYLYLSHCSKPNNWLQPQTKLETVFLKAGCSQCNTTP